MANKDRPKGFRPVKPRVASARSWTYPTNASLTCDEGDPLKLNSSGELIAALATDTFVHSIALQAVASGSPTTAKVAKVRDWIFEAQCSGTYAEASMDFTLLDIEGTAGSTAFEVNENATSTKVVQSLGLVGTPGNVDGANANILVIFTRAQGEGDDADLVYVTAAGLGAAGTFSLATQSPVAGTLESFAWCQSGATSSSTAADNWILTGTDGGGNDQGFSHDSDADTPVDGEIAANTPLTFVPSTNTTVTAGEILLAVMTEEGTATDLAAVYCTGTWAIRVA